MNILETKNLEKVYDAFSLRDINLEVRKGEITALVGENGAGKSTTIGCLSGIKKKSGGKILFKGKDMDSLSREERSEIAFAYDEISFPLEFTVSQVGKYGSILYSNWDEGKWLNLLTKLSLPKDRKLKELSKGMKAKTEIAYSLSHDPSLLILDETTSSLDPVVRDELMDLFQSFVEDGEKAILFSSHITSDLEKIADRIIFIHKGRLILAIDRNELDEKWALVHAEKDSGWEKEKEVEHFRVRPYSIDLLVSDISSFLSRHPDAQREKADIETILLMLARGEEE